jgi:hypothetical protein
MYLVTKQKYWGKPTLVSLQQSVRAMLDDIATRKIECLVMPMIGCGLDLLKWTDVKMMLEKELVNRPWPKQLIICDKNLST